MRKMTDYIKALEGITYSDWVKLKIGMERAFEYQKGEFERKLKFANVDVVKDTIRIQFGQTSD